MPTAVPARPGASRLFVGGAVALLALLLLCAATAAGYASAVRWVEHTLRVEEELDAWANALVEIQNDSRGFIATGNPVFVRDRAKLLTTEQAKLQALRALIADNPSQLSAVANANREVRYAEDLGRRYPTPPDAPTGVPQVIRTGESELYPEIPSELLEAGARDADHLRIIRELQLKSAMVVPLRARGRTFGAMTFVYADSDRRYSTEDLAFAEDLARRAAMAIENSIALKDADRARDRERWMREEAERTNRLKDDFLATVSHELRTPLNAILGWTMTLRGGSIDTETDRALAIVERNARAQAKLIEDVLDVSRIVSGKLALHLGPTSVAAAARAAIETVTPAADAKSISVVSEIPSEPSSITADADRLQQVIWNLLSNAIKFTPKNGRVLLRVFREASDVCVSVKDSGEGIRSDMLSAIFEPFQQADASTTRRHGGLGLGLAIVKQLVSAHGGSVEAQSDGQGKGSIFTVRLPVRAVAVAQSETGEVAATAAPDPLLATAPNVRLDGLSVLVVDDELDALAPARNFEPVWRRGHGCGVRSRGPLGARAKQTRRDRQRYRHAR